MRGRAGEQTNEEDNEGNLKQAIGGRWGGGGKAGIAQKGGGYVLKGRDVGRTEAGKRL